MRCFRGWSAGHSRISCCGAMVGIPATQPACVQILVVDSPPTTTTTEARFPRGVCGARKLGEPASYAVSRPGRVDARSTLQCMDLNYCERLCTSLRIQCQFARVAKGVDLRSTAGNCAWARTPQLTRCFWALESSCKLPGVSSWSPPFPVRFSCSWGSLGRMCPAPTPDMLYWALGPGCKLSSVSHRPPLIPERYI